MSFPLLLPLLPGAVVSSVGVGDGLGGGIFNDRGTVAPGQRADLILLCHKDERHLAYELGGNPVDLVIVRGNVVK